MKRGFTLIEMLVSVAIFVIVMVIALGSLLSVSAADRRAETLKSVMNNLNFALDSMTRSIRTGRDYHCGSTAGGNCPSGASDFAFTDVSTHLVEYQLSGTSILRYTTDLTNGNAVLENGLPLTAPEVQISTLNFNLIGYCTASGTTNSGLPPGCTPDTLQPRVVITVKGKISLPGQQDAVFDVQTTVTQRLYDQ